MVKVTEDFITGSDNLARERRGRYEICNGWYKSVATEQTSYRSFV